MWNCCRVCKKEGAILVVSTRDRNTDLSIDYADVSTRLVFLNEFDPEYQWLLLLNLTSISSHTLQSFLQLTHTFLKTPIEFKWSKTWQCVTSQSNSSNCSMGESLINETMQVLPIKVYDYWNGVS